MKVLITGGTGLIGKEIGKALVSLGHQVVVIARSQDKARSVLPFSAEIIEGDLTRGPLRHQLLSEVDAVINLLGEPVIGGSVLSGRWTDKKKKSIRESRVLGTRNLIASLGSQVKVFVSGSAIGFYGSCGSEIISEDHAAGRDFLAEVCMEWEKEARNFKGRQVMVRTGIVLSSAGGALEKMLLPFRLGLGGIIGAGDAWMSWIHMDDLVSMFVFALENEKVEGPINGAAPRPVTNKEFSKSLAQALGKNLGPRVPEIALKMLFGEASEAILSSVRASAAKIEALSFRYEFTDVDDALQTICGPLRTGDEVFEAEQFIPETQEKVFNYFREAHNLEELTPPTMNFRIDQVSTESVQQGTLIDYRLKIYGFPFKWKTEIDEWKPPYKFVDTQLLGPYRLWHHTHEFHEVPGGTLMTDRVRYRLPMGKLGWVMGGLFVKKEVEKIFSYRRKKVMSAYFAVHADK